MKKLFRTRAVVSGLLLSSCVVPVVSADDIEIYTTLGSAGSSSNPNIMFLIDTSGSMGTTSKVKESYDESSTYLGACKSTGIYFVEDGKLPDCTTSTDYFNESALVCDHAVTGYAADGGKITPPQDGSLLSVGTYSDQFAQFETPVRKKWREVSVGVSADRDFKVECLSDSGIHGDGGGAKKYIADGSTGFTSSVPVDPDVPHAVWTGGAGNVQIFAGNYLNYLSDATVPLVDKSYIEQVKSAVEVMVRGNTQVDIGLMCFDSSHNGGSVQYPILDVGADRNDFFSRLKNLDADGFTPLSEAYYEALLYFGGKDADFSLISNPGNAVVSKTMMPGNTTFRSPITSTCDKNYIVVLSDGEPFFDHLNADRRRALPGFNAGSCNGTTPWGGFFGLFWNYNQDAFNSTGSVNDNCLDELAEWAHTHDVAEITGGIYDEAHDGDQFLTTHMIGFELADAGAVQLMTDAASKGGGNFYAASSEAQLIKIFNQIVASTLNVNTTFSSPAVSVNAFNRSIHLNDLYFTLFKPGVGNHWDGNLKKYKLKFKQQNDGTVDPFIADNNNAIAIDPTTGFFSSIAQSFWSADIDGKEVGLGGAANNLTANRNVYTFTGNYAVTNGVAVPSSKNLTAASNEVDTSNGSLTDAMLGISGFSPLIAGTTYRETMINWAAGRDALSKYGEADTYNDARSQMGDPLHAEPALVQYGGDLNNPDLVAFVATNDGYLHAIETKTGTELFSFIPQELLDSLPVAMENSGGKKLYGLDGSVIAWINDKDGNGSIDGADHVFLYVAMRRGGRDIYALDVTDKTNPQFMWKIQGGVGDYEELGDTWSTLNVEQVKDGADAKTVLIFGGGYDTAQDSVEETTADDVGRTIFIADATTGERLWSGGKGGDGTVEMEYSIPARVKPLDISGDGFIDRLYAADMGGQIFRFDIDNKNDAVLSSSITGARIAKLSGTGKDGARRFYYPPDVAVVDAPDGKYHALVLSSGYRAHPLNEDVHDRIYMIKDRQTSYTDTITTDIDEGDLKDTTLNLAGGDGASDAARKAEFDLIANAEGWYIDLDDSANPGTWLGEKGLSEALIQEGVVSISTYTPNMGVSDNACEPNLGLGKVYAVDVLDATPAYPQDIDKRDQRHSPLYRTGIPAPPTLVLPKDGEPTICVGTECKAADLGLGVRKTYWYEVEN